MELVGFELLLPALVERAQQAGVAVPAHLDIYAAQRAEKLRLIPPAALYGPSTTAVHSLEFLGDRADLDGLRRAQAANGSVGNSPAATAFYFARSGDSRALAYLEESVARVGGAMAPVLYPCETFELLWSAYHLFLAGVPARRLLSHTERDALLHSLQNGGVSLSPTFPIPDADDTAVALLLLHDLGESVRPAVLEPFATQAGFFASFPHERHSSVGVNLHALHALAAVPGFPDAPRAIDRVIDYVVDQQVRGLYWIDKWHISPYYATSHALCLHHALPAPLARRLDPVMERARGWLRQTQNEDGSWGFYGASTAEETAYGLLALAAGATSGTGDPATPADRRRCAAAARYLRETEGTVPPPMWIDKCLYTPTLVVQTVIEAALVAHKRLQSASAA
jgi:halimadienyl-diphosphate synthase